MVNTTNHPPCAVLHQYPKRYQRKLTSDYPALCVGQGGDLLAAWGERFAGIEAWAGGLHAGGDLDQCFVVDDMFVTAYLRFTGAVVRTLDWTRKMQAGVRAINASTTYCRLACSPLQLRLRYPDSLAMGPKRENGNIGCMRQLGALGRWPNGNWTGAGAPGPTACEVGVAVD